MLSLAEYERLKNAHDKAKREAAEAEGAHAAALKRLKADFGLATLEEAQERLAELEAELEKLESKLDTAVAEFKDALAENG